MSTMGEDGPKQRIDPQCRGGQKRRRSRERERKK